ncbi:MAG: RNA polymerase sigma-70 factor (ECF subfamily) [Candidatus Azotimanducaceae bacterium]|jgi:RNA polymerase sigma-70 factor (ECF subfamily)
MSDADEPSMLNNKHESISCAKHLVYAIQNGDREAEDHFCRQYRVVAIATLRQRTDNNALVDDLTNDVLITVLLKIRDKSIIHPERLRSYVIQTARFKLIDWYRRKDNQTKAMCGELPCHQIGFEDRILQMQSAKIVRKMMDGLKVPRDKEILHRSYLLDETKVNICRELNLNSQNFDKVIYRARQRLREVMELQEPEILLALLSDAQVEAHYA